MPCSCPYCWAGSSRLSHCHLIASPRSCRSCGARRATSTTGTCPDDLTGWVDERAKRSRGIWPTSCYRAEMGWRSPLVHLSGEPFNTNGFSMFLVPLQMHCRSRGRTVSAYVLLSQRSWAFFAVSWKQGLSSLHQATSSTIASSFLPDPYMLCAFPMGC